MRSRVEKEQEKANGQKISQLTENTEKLTRENDLQKTRIQQLSDDYKKLHDEFERFR